MKKLPPPTAAALTSVAKFFNSKFVNKKYVIYFNLGNSIKSLTLNFDKKNFLHLVGLKPTKITKEFAKTLRKSEFEILFDLILIERYKNSDLDF